MDDLQTLRTALAVADPTPDVVDRSRHRLRNRMIGTQPPRRRFRPLTIAAGLAAAAAVAVVVAATLPDPGERPESPQAAAPVVTGQQVLLAAATVVAGAPATTGEYWHVGTKTEEIQYDYWTSKDGRSWFRGEKTGGRVERLHVESPFNLGFAAVTLEQILALPADPEALRSWIADANLRSGARTSAGEPTAADRDEQVLLGLVSLVSSAPASPPVRAAAFRAIATYPGVTALGAVPGGQGVLLPGDLRLVVDPATGRVNRTSVFVSNDGALHSTPHPQGAAISAEWTDSLPR
ncbi:CU044_5270 family protein [Amycolatopsis sp. NPDC089917]|uniref:CU044_5270 family protein n=1 Tax=Amycolatopsis sp. NPDC089917 TaxID=3155187 RepID=UPI00341EFB6A